MGFFFPSPRKPATSTPLSSSHHVSPSEPARHEAHHDQHGSRHGEISGREWHAGMHHEISKAFHGHEAQAISALVQGQMDNRSSHSGTRHVLDKGEAEKILQNVHEMYSKDHAERLRRIFDKRLE